MYKTVDIPSKWYFIIVKFYDDIEKGVDWSIDELRKRVKRITKKSLEYFLKKGRH